MQTTTNYGYKVVEGTDSPVNIQNDVAPNFTDIDADLKAVSDAAITTATHTLSGTIHALVRADADRSVLMFTATGDMTTGDTFTVDGVSVTARLVNGEALKTGAFMINNTIIAILVGTVLNILAVNPTIAPTASGVSYDNTISGLTASDVQDALDELAASLGASVNLQVETGTTLVDLLLALSNLSDTEKDTCSITINTSDYGVFTVRKATATIYNSIIFAGSVVNCFMLDIPNSRLIVRGFAYGANSYTDTTPSFISYKLMYFR